VQCAVFPDKESNLLCHNLLISAKKKLLDDQCRKAKSHEEAASISDGPSWII